MATMEFLKRCNYHDQVGSQSLNDIIQITKIPWDFNSNYFERKIRE